MPFTESPHLVVERSVAMASAISVTLVAGEPARQLAARTIQVFDDVDRTCTRFDPASDLMRANRGAARRWVPVHRYCFEALGEAYAAYRRTGGRFDPRVLTDLDRLGYDMSYTTRAPVAADERRALHPRRRARSPWRPRFRGESSEVQLGRHPVDLGGIGKGLALRWAAELVRHGGGRRFLLDAGGDVVCGGSPDDGSHWRVSVEDPAGGETAVAVLALSDEAVATSSIRLRHWYVGDTRVHHLIDPRTGLPGGEGIASVTVVDRDPAAAEVWSKVLFLAGRRGIAPAAARHEVPCLWVTDDGRLGWSASLGERLLWTR